MRLVSPLVFPSYSKSAWLTIGFSRAAPGKSHSGETPTTSSPRPRAKQISVAAGRRETIRIGFDCHDSGGTAKNGVQSGGPQPPRRHFLINLLFSPLALGEKILPSYPPTKGGGHNSP